MTEEHSTDPQLKEVLNAPHFTFFWAFVTAWAAFRKTPNGNPEEFLGQQKDLACQYGVSTSLPRQNPPVTTTYASRASAVEKKQPKVIDLQTDGVRTAERIQKPNHANDRADGNHRMSDHPKAISVATPTPPLPNMQQTVPKPAPSTTHIHSSKAVEPRSQVCFLFFFSKSTFD